jgi:O-acetyl-ADP-ribose deacetylase (regulator of RNase III)
MKDSFSISGLNVEIIQGDITEQKVDVIINAANQYLLHGAGVARAILEKGGDIIQQESENWIKNHGPVTFDHPAITSGGSLPSKYVIHAVGPVWGEGDEVQKLENTVLSSLSISNELKCRTVAFPAISTGIFGFPVQQAAICFINAIEKFAQKPELFFIQTIRIVLFDIFTYKVFIAAFLRRENLSQ